MRRTGRPRTLRLRVSAVAVAGLLFGACGSDAAVVKDDPDGFLLDRAIAAADGESAATFNTSSFAVDVDLFMTGRIDEATQLMAVNVQLPASDDHVKVDMVFDASSELLYFDGSKLNPDESLAKWVAVDMSNPRGAIRSFTAIADVNPLEVIRMFDASRSARAVGIERVDGIDAKHFIVSVPTEKAIATQPGIFVDIPKVALGAIPSIDYDVWVTRDNQVHSMSFSFEVERTLVEFDMTIVDFGPVDPIALPSPDDVRLVNGVPSS